MSVAAIGGSNFQPGVPVIQGLTPLVSQNNTNNSYALFAFNTAGQNTINLTGINSTDVPAERLYNGQYGLQLTVAGDINLDKKVDATDAQLLNQALGITSNNTGYSLNLDINRDGVINNSDLELLNQNVGFVANTPAVITPSNILTHQELETTIDLEKLVSDADNDALTYSISNPVNGTLETLNNGQTVVFKPASNFAGVGSFDISVDDGYYKASETININVSDAPLINLEFVETKKQLNVGETISLVETFWQNVCTKEILPMLKMLFYQILI